MGSPGGQIVGRVSVRVLPDTSNFRREAKAKLETATEGLEAEVDVTIDSTGLRQKIRAAAAAASRGVDAQIGVDVNPFRTALARAINGLDDEVTVRVDLDVDRDALRRLAQTSSRAFGKTANRTFGRNVGGGNILLRTFGRIIPLVHQLGSEIRGLFNIIRRNIRTLREGVDGVRQSADDGAAALGRIRDNARSAAASVSGIRDNLRDATDASDRVENSARNLPVLWRDAQREALELAESIRQAARTEENRLRIAAEMDDSAMARFRRDFRRAMDKIREDVTAGRRGFVVGPDGAREITIFEAAFNRSIDRIRRSLRTVFSGLVIVTRTVGTGIGASFRGIATAVRTVANEVRNIGDRWRQLNVFIVRTRLLLERLDARVDQALNRRIDGLNRGINRAYIELFRTIDGTVRAINRTITGTQTLFRRLGEIAQEGARRITAAFRTVRDGVVIGATRGWAALERTVVGALRGIQNGITRTQVALNRFNLITEQGARRLTEVFRSLRNEGFGPRLYDGASRFADAVRRASAYTRDLGSRWYDIQRGVLLAEDATGRFVRRIVDVDRQAARIRDGFNRVRTAIANISFDRVRSGVISAGDSVVRFGRRGRNAITGFGQLVQSVARLGFSGIGIAASAAAEGVSNAFRAAGSSIGSIFSGFQTLLKGVGGQILQIASTILSLVGIAALLGGISALLLTLGAGISGVWAALSATISALPAALFLLGAPIAAIALGLDGIKAAARTLQPEFDAMRARVSATFERGLIPVFERLRSIMPLISDGMVGIANSLVGVGDRLARVVTEGENVGRLEDVIGNVKTAVDGLGVAFEDIFVALLETGSMKAGFDALVGFVQEFAAQWRASIEELSAGTDSTLERSFQGLEALLGAVARAFTGLIENGIKAFSTAAPGMTKSLDSLTNFFGRFDWERIGAAVGNVFEGIGETLDQVNPSTIDRITAAFEKIGQTFRDPALQNMFANVIRGIPEVLAIMDSLIGTFARVASASIGLLQILQGLGAGIAAFFAGDWAGLAKAGASVYLGWDAIKDAFTAGSAGAAGIARSSGTIIARNLNEALALGLNSTKDIATNALGRDGVGAAITMELQKIPASAGSALAPLPGAIGSAIAPAAGAAGTAAGAVPPAVGAGLQPVNATAASVLGQLAPIFQDAFGGLSVYAAMGMAKVAEGVNQGSLAVQNSFRLAFVGLGPIVTTAFAGLAVTAAMGMGQIATGVTNGMIAVQNAIRLGLESVNLLILAGVDVWGLSVQLGLTQMSTGVAAGFAAVQAAVFAAMAAINLVILAGVQVWGLSVQLGLAQMAAGITTSFATVQAAVFAALTRINLLIIAGVTVWGLSLQLGLLGMAAIVTSQFNAIYAAVFNGMTRCNLAIIAGVQVWVISFQTGMATIVTTVTAGMNAISAAITSGMARAVSTLRSAVAAMVSTLNSAVGQFRAAGANMGQALADGLNSKVGAVQAAANRLASAAAAAARAAAQIASPSKVFTLIGELMGQGTAVGLDRSRRIVERSADKLIGAAVKTATKYASAFSDTSVGTDLVDRIESQVPAVQRAMNGTVSTDWNAAISSDGFGDVGDRVAEALDGWQVVIDANGIAKLVNKSNTRKARR